VVAEAIWRAVRDNRTLRIRYTDIGGQQTEREVEPLHIVVGPNGSYLTAWCHLRKDDRVFRLDRVTRADPVAAPSHPMRVAREPAVDGHQTRLPAFALRGDDRLQTPT
jgi:predicted DNA-binding transcriptional regulator YafY